MKIKTTKIITVLALAIAMFNAKAQTPAKPSVLGTLFVCSGSSTSFTATGASGATFAWSSDTTTGGLLSSSANYTTPALTANTYYYVRQTVSGSNSAWASVYVLVTKIPNPTQPINVVAVPTTICQGNSANLSATVDSSAGQHVYWYNAATGGTLLGSSVTGANFVVSPTVNTTYYAQSAIYQVVKVFNKTGGVQSFTVPAGVTSINIDASGGRGGNCYEPGQYNTGGYNGGYGGRVQATMNVTPGQVLSLYVGSRGYGDPACYPCNEVNGWNGGGTVPNGVSSASGTGGDATDIRIGGTALTNRVLVVGGGGGGSTNSGSGGNGGAGGGLTGANGIPNPSIGDSPAGGGTQSAGGAAFCKSGVCANGGSLGNGGNASSYSGNYGGAGGGGLYGGASGFLGDGGGGGSSYTNNLFQNVVHTQGYNSGDGIITISYNTGSGCGSNTRVAVTVSVNTTPTVTVTNNFTTCSGTSVSLTAGGANTYSWQPGNLTGTTVTVTPSASTTYTVTGKLTSGGCTNTNKVTVSVTSVSTNGSLAVCKGQGANLGANGADSTYIWNPGNISGQNITVYPTTTTVYTVTGINKTKCSTTAIATVTVNPLPTVSAGTNTTVLQGNSITLVASGADAYSWSPIPSSSNSLTCSPSVTSTFVVVGTYTATGCQNSAQVTVTVTPAAVITGTTTICQGSSAVLTATGTGPFTWWNSQTGGTLLYTGATYTTPTLTSSASYWVSANGGQRVQVNVNADASVPSNVTASPSSVCLGSSTKLSATGVDSIKWYNAATGGTLLGTLISGANFVVSPTVTTTYYAAAAAQQVVKVFNKTGGVQSFTVPAGVTSINIDASGGRGGNCYEPGQYNTGGYNGGYGGRVQATMNVTPGQVLSLYVGSRGYGDPACYPCNEVNGWNGGGTVPNGVSSASGTGGDATDIRIGGTALTNRVLVVGGGGGGSTNSGSGGNGGAGGGLTGANGIPNPSIGDSPAGGGTQSAGGAAFCKSGVCANGGSFGNGGNASSYSGNYGGAGGGGWFGGASGFLGDGGGGGSSYTNDLFQNVVHTQGYNANDGIITITYNTNCTASARTPITVTVNTTPTLTVNSGTICAGNSFTISPSGANTYTYSSGNSVVSPTTTTSYSVAGTNTVTGCVSSSASTTVTVNKLPILTLNSGSLCTGNSFTITPNSTTAISYTYSSGNSVVSPTTTTNYTVSGTDANGCVGSKSDTVAVYSCALDADLNFDGTNDYVSVNTGSNSLSAPFTVEAWVNPGNASNTMTILSARSPSDEGFDFKVKGGNTIHADIGNGSTWITTSADATYAYAVGQWVHIAYVVTNVGYSIYANGNKVGSGTFSGSPLLFNSSHALSIGSVAGSSEFFNGNIDEVRIWNSALCQGVIQNNMNAELQLPQTGLVAYYKFNEGMVGPNNFTVTTAVDSSGSNYAGTLHNFALTGATSNWETPGAIASGIYAPAFVSPSIHISGDSVICTGATTTLIVKGNVSTYSWIAGPTTAMNVVSPTVNTTYSVVGTNSVGCTSNYAVTTVTVNTLPIITVNSGTICAGQSFTITPNSATASSFTYSPIGPVVSPTLTSNYTVSGTDANGCVGSNSDTVNVNKLPIITVNSGTICVGQSFTLTPGGASSYEYSSGSSVVSPTTTTSYTVTGTSGKGCMDTASVVIDVNKLPTLTLTASSATVCTSSSVTLTPGGASTYTLTNTNATGTIFTNSPSTTTQYTVTGTDNNGCVNKDTLSVVVIACTTDISRLEGNNSQVLLYPNPNNGSFTISIDNLTINATLEIYNGIGQLVYSQAMNKEFETINTNLMNGFYTVKIQNGQGNTIKHIVIAQ